MSHRLACLVISLCIAATGSTARAQVNVGGVYVDPQGMLRDSTTLSQDELAKLQPRDLFASTTAGPVTAASTLRKVSLKQLEATVAARQAEGKPLPAEIRYLAGLQSVQSVVFDPETGDVILSGPAEGWKQLPTGEIVGERSGHPVLHLEDLVVVLRFLFNPRTSAFLGCSIDPTQAGLQGYANYFAGLGKPDQTRVSEMLRGIERAMGPQDVTLYGVPGQSRAALVLAAADYRLKRLSMGHDPAPTRKFFSYFDLAAKSYNGGKFQQHRFWFVGRFDAIRHTPDDLIWSIEGQGVQVATAPTESSFTGQTGPKPSRQATLFVESFTKQFPEVAQQVPVFLEMQNVINLSTVAAIIYRRASVKTTEEAAGGGEPSPASWRPVHFLDEAACPLAAYPVPKQVPSLATVRFVKNRHWMFAVSGGVEINIADLLDPERVKPAETLATTRADALRTRDQRWWWD